MDFDISKFNYVEITVAVVFIIFFVKGYLKGFIGELVSIISMILAIFGVALAMKIIGSSVSGKANDALQAGIVLIVLIILMQVFRVIIVSLKIFSKLPLINGLNKLLGMIFGLAEGLLLVWLAFIILCTYNIFDKNVEILSMIGNNQILVFLFENNLLVKLFA